MNIVDRRGAVIKLKGHRGFVKRYRMIQQLFRGEGSM
jgi:hypothetical protein